eukprot:scaffold14763_cov137-Amphora_coffeaeformis.AAC.1
MEPTTPQDIVNSRTMEKDALRLEVETSYTRILQHDLQCLASVTAVLREEAPSWTLIAGVCYYYVSHSYVAEYDYILFAQGLDNLSQAVALFPSVGRIKFAILPYLYATKKEKKMQRSFVNRFIVTVRLVPQPNRSFGRGKGYLNHELFPVTYLC